MEICDPMELPPPAIHPLGINRKKKLLGQPSSFPAESLHEAHRRTRCVTARPKVPRVAQPGARDQPLGSGLRRILRAVRDSVLRACSREGTWERMRKVLSSLALGLSLVAASATAVSASPERSLLSWYRTRWDQTSEYMLETIEGLKYDEFRGTTRLSIGSANEYSSPRRWVTG